MAAWFEGMFGADYGPVVMWSAMLLGAAIIVMVLYWVIRRAMSGTFVVGGKGRRPRLAVLDAAAVDSRRRLVLIRRDNKEHLIMIGGPTDLVVERGIDPEEEAVEATRTVPELAPKKTAQQPGPKAPEKQVSEPVAKPTVAAKQPTPTADVPPQGVAVVASHPNDSATGGVAQTSRTISVDRNAAVASSAAAISASSTAAAMPASGNTQSSKTPEAAEATQPPPAAASAPPPVERTAEAVAVPVPAANKADLDAALLKELETTLDAPRERAGERAGRTDEIDKDMADMIAEFGRERA